MENHHIFMCKSTNSTGHVQIQQRRQAHLGGDLIVAQIQLLEFMSLNVSMNMYVCMKVCLYVCMHACMRVCHDVWHDVCHDACHDVCHDVYTKVGIYS